MSDNVRMAASYTAKITTPVAPAMKAALEELARREEVPPTIIQRRAFSAYLNKQEATKWTHSPNGPARASAARCGTPPS